MAVTEWPEMSAAAAARLVAGPATRPLIKLQACNALVLRGVTREALPVLAELEKQPEFAFDARRLMGRARAAATRLARLDFVGKRPAQGRWATLDGSAPGSASESTGALLWLRPDSRKVILTFSAPLGNFGPGRDWISIWLLQRVLASFPVNIVYLRDATACLHFAGVHRLGNNYASCLTGLRGLCERFGWRDLYGLGISGGGFSALRFGLDLGVRGVLSLSGPTTLAAPTDPKRRKPILQPFFRTLSEHAIDLVPLFRRSAVRPRMFLCFAEHHAYDAEMARRMAQFSEVELVPIVGFDRHSILMEGIRDDKLQKIVARMVA